MVLPYGCSSEKNDDKMSADHVLTDAERSAGILTPEVMWKIKRVGSAVLARRRTVLYTVTTYDMKENKGVTNIRSAPVSGGKWIRGHRSRQQRVVASVERRRTYDLFYFRPRRQRPGLVCGSGREQPSSGDRHLRRRRGFSVAPSENRLMYVARVPVESAVRRKFIPIWDRFEGEDLRRPDGAPLELLGRRELPS